MCQTFECTVPEAVEMLAPAWRRLTRATVDAMRAARLKAQADDPKGKSSEGWTDSDHAFWLELLKASGFEQPPIG